MPPFRSKRIYNPLALEIWFENVTFDWETSFSKETLKEGKQFTEKDSSPVWNWTKMKLLYIVHLNVKTSVTLSLNGVNRAYVRLNEDSQIGRAGCSRGTL